MYHQYYQACIERKDCWFFTAIIRSFEYLAFDRTLDAQASIFEFFVTPEREDEFLAVMKRLEQEGIVSGLTKLPNRLLDPAEVV